MKINRSNNSNLFIQPSVLFTMMFLTLASVKGWSQKAATSKKTAAEAASQPVKKGYAPVNGLQLYYEITGSGQPVVLLHGGLVSHEMFGTGIQELAKGRQIIAVDLQGHGRTGDIDRPLNAELMADDIAALLKHLGISQADIIGYSMGGSVALQTAIRHTAMVRKLVLVSTPFRRSAFHPEILASQDYMGAETADALQQTPIYGMYASVAPKPADWKKLVIKMGENLRRDYDWSEQVKAIKLPTLIMAGDADIFRPSHAVAFYELLGGGLKDGNWDGSGQIISKLAILPGATHYNIAMHPSFVSTAAGFLDAVATK